MSQIVAERALNETAPPPAGGRIEEGTWILNDLTTYTPGGTSEVPTNTGTYVRSTLRVAAGTLLFTRSQGTDHKAMPPDSVEAYTFTQNEATVGVTRSCGTNGSATSYTVSATKDFINFHTARGVESYRRKR